MSQLPNPPRLGIQIALNAPGLAVNTRPASANALLAADAMHALGELGDAATLYRTTIDRQRAEEEFRERQTEEGQARIAREREQADKDAKELYEGMASRQAQGELPTITRQIVDGEIDALKGDGNPLEKANAYADSLTAGQPAAYRDRFRDLVVPKFVEAQERRREQLREQGRRSNNQLLAEGLKVAESPVKASQILAAAQRNNPDASPVDIATEVIKPAMDWAADQGDVERVQMFQGLLKDHLPEERAQATARANDVRNRFADAQKESVRQSVHGLWTSGTPFEQVDRFLRDPKLPVDNITRDTLIQENDARRRRSESETSKLSLETQTREAEARIAQVADAAIGAGNAWQIDDVEVPIEGGSVKKTRNELIEESFERAFDRIVKTPGLEPPQMVSEQIRLATLNDYAPASWTRLMASGATAMSAINIDDPKTEQPIPESAVRALALYTRVRETSRPLADKLTPNEKVQDLYETAIALMDDPSVGADPSRALLSARRLLSGGVPTSLTAQASRTIDDQAGSIASRLIFSDAKNTGEIKAEIVRHATWLARSGLSPDRAVERASKTVEASGVIINGWWSPAKSVDIPDTLRGDLPAASEVLIADFAKKHGAAIGLDADDLTMRMDRDNGLWYMSDARTGLPLPITGGITPSEHIFDAAGFLRRVESMKKSGVLEAMKNRKGDTFKELRIVPSATMRFGL